MVTAIVLVPVVLVAALLAYAASRPDTMHVQRSVSVNAPADHIFPLIADFVACIPKVIGVFVNMDAMIGKSFEQGVTNLKAIVERGSRPNA
jgi:hypothetical protein